MPDNVKNVFGGMKNGWDKVDKKKRKILIGVVASVLVIGLIIGLAGSKTDYSLLFSNLELSDAGNIVTDLEAKKIKYTLEDNGRTILIESKMVDTYRMDLAMNNMLPDSSTGFEIFDNTGLMVTNEDRQIMYQRALTGELQRTISSLDGISSAKVHLVMPQKSIFETEARNASASVVIDIRSGSKISESSIRGIASLVSGAVDNMPIENVQVISSNGILLSAFLLDGENNSIGSTLDQLSASRTRFEKEIEGKLLALLGGTYGFDKIKVSVMADLDFDSEEYTIIAYSDPVVRSEQVSATGEKVNQQEVTGGSIDDNISNVFENEENGSQSFNKITNNELTTETRSVIRAPGQVRKITTSIVFSGNLTEQERTNIQSIVAAATGYDNDRGDFISVVGVDIPSDAPIIVDTPEPVNPIMAMMQENLILSVVIISVLAIILLIIIVVLIKKKRKRDKEDLEFRMAIENNASIDKLFGEEDDDDDIKIDIKQDSNVKKAKKYAEDYPELAVDLIRSWIKE